MVPVACEPFQWSFSKPQLTYIFSRDTQQALRSSRLCGKRPGIPASRFLFGPPLLEWAYHLLLKLCLKKKARRLNLSLIVSIAVIAVWEHVLTDMDVALASVHCWRWASHPGSTPGHWKSVP